MASSAASIHRRTYLQVGNELAHFARHSSQQPCRCVSSRTGSARRVAISSPAQSESSPTPTFQIGELVSTLPPAAAPDGQSLVRFELPQIQLPWMELLGSKKRLN